MENYLTIDGIDCVTITNADGSTWSGFKSAFDEMQKKQSIPKTDFK